jgi:hypothetical protein
MTDNEPVLTEFQKWRAEKPFDPAKLWAEMDDEIWDAILVACKSGLAANQASTSVSSAATKTNAD